MFAPTDMLILSVLQTAVASPLGIEIKTNDVTKARSEIYRVRKSFGEPAMQDIQVRVCPSDPGSRLWLLRKGEVNSLTVTLDERSLLDA